jgi:hypothetical protein
VCIHDNRRRIIVALQQPFSGKAPDNEERTISGRHTRYRGTRRM